MSVSSRVVRLVDCIGSLISNVSVAESIYATECGKNQVLRNTERVLRYHTFRYLCLVCNYQ